MALLDLLEVESCHWVGVSIGAMVGMRLASRNSDRVRSLTLISVTVRPLTRLEMLPFDASAGLIRATSPRGRIGTAVRRQVAGMSVRMIFGSTFISDPARSADRENWRTRFAEQLVAEGATMMREVFGFPGNPVELLARITAPPLVIYGADDLGADVEARKAHHAIPGARLLRIPGRGT